MNKLKSEVIKLNIRQSALEVFLITAALISTLSLHPFDFSTDHASYRYLLDWEAVKSLSCLFSIDSITNLLAFIPLSIALFTYLKLSRLNFPVIRFLIISLTISIFLEGLQIFLASRVASWQDILAQQAGSIIAIFIYSACGKFNLNKINSFTESTFAKYLLLILAYSLVTYSACYSLDFQTNININILQTKWQTLTAMPYISENFNYYQLIRQMEKLIIFVPLGFFSAAIYKQNALYKTILTGFNILFAFSIEFFQLFLMHHTASSTDFFTYIAGIVLGEFIFETIYVNKLSKRDIKKLAKYNLINHKQTA